MSNEQEDFTQEEVATSQMDSMGKLDIAQLRALAKMFSIPSERNWTKEDYIRAIKRHADNSNMAQFVIDGGQAPAPGYARVLLHRDPTPGHKNPPVHLTLNGHILQVPRGIEVDIPKDFVGVLNDAITVVTEQVSSDNETGGVTSKFVDEKRTSYPFQVIAITPGTWKNYNDPRGPDAAARQACCDALGHWPTQGEFNEWSKQQIRKSN